MICDVCIQTHDFVVVIVNDDLNIKTLLFQGNFQSHFRSQNKHTKRESSYNMIWTRNIGFAIFRSYMNENQQKKTLPEINLFF